MGRPREFDREAVLDRALEVFWERGYEATSVQNLVDGMGINRGSLYDTFGDKHTLFLAALDRYDQVWVTRVVDALAEPGPVRARVRGVFEEASCEAARAERRGCFATNSAVELAPRDSCVAERFAGTLTRVETAFRRALLEAQRGGEIAADSDAPALARVLTSGLLGVRVMARAGADPDPLRDAVRVTVATLG